MAAYAALVSVMHIIDRLRAHPRPPITLQKEQAYLLTEKVAFLQEFLQVYNPNLPYSKETDPLESRIARAAYAAEDAIESHIADQYTDDEEKMSSDGLHQALDKVIEDMALIEKEALMVINKETGGFQNQLHTKSTPPNSSKSSSSSPIVQKRSMMVGADDLLLELKGKLTSDARDLQTIPIVGMGGSGKTTLALSIYQDGLIKEHFHTCAWVTISQEYSIREILAQLLTQLISEPDKGLSEGELGEMLHKHLYGKRFMIILDDMWNIEAWDGVKRSLPNNKKASRVVITTRLTTLASTLSNSNSLGMKLLDEDDSWDLLSKTVFGEKGYCPLEFEKIGKKIGKSCKGLPLSIVVVGGLLAKSNKTIEFWENIEGNLNAIVNLEDEERCLKTLYMSYKQLPVHLKPCLLYMGIYREDHAIDIPKLIKLWIAEGFVKPLSGKMLEDAARAYLEDLCNRNLIFIHKFGSIGSIKECKIHDLLRDLCLREAQKEGFYIVYPGHEIGNEMSRIVMSGGIQDIEEIDGLSSMPVARSLILNFDDCYDYYYELPPSICRRLRIVGSDVVTYRFPERELQLVNSRVITFQGRKFAWNSRLMWLFWNLQTLIVNPFMQMRMTMSSDIWCMTHIRHIYITGLYFPNPPNVEDGIVLVNLQSMGWIWNFKCSEQVVKRIPNIIKLKISYKEGVDDSFCLTNLDCLDKLESLSFCFKQLKCQINYPRSLKKLALAISGSQCWQDILDKIGMLPLLQKLQLSGGSFVEEQWETSDGQFRSLKFLALEWSKGIKVWTSEASHFPRLEHLHLVGLDNLEEVPLDFAEISTLRLIAIETCSDSAVESANRILEEQVALYGEDETTLQIQVKLSRSNSPALESFKSPNFHVRFEN